MLTLFEHRSRSRNVAGAADEDGAGAAEEADEDDDGNDEDEADEAEADEEELDVNVARAIDSDQPPKTNMLRPASMHACELCGCGGVPHVTARVHCAVITAFGSDRSVGTLTERIHTVLLNDRSSCSPPNTIKRDVTSSQTAE